MLSLYKLEIFTLVAQLGSFTAAAEQLYMTQSAVSQHMKDLEIHLGTKLFKRGRWGVILTPSGEKLQDYTQRILHLLAEAEADITDVSQLARGQAAIGSNPTIGVYLIPTWLREFRSNYPNLSLALKTGTTLEIIDQVLSHQLDLGIVEGELDQKQLDKQIGSLELKEFELFVVVGPHHEWWERPSVTLAELDGQAFVLRQPRSQTRVWVDQIFQQNHINPTINGEFDSPESIKQAVMLGTCISILPDYAISQEQANQSLRLVAVEDISLRRTLKLIWDAHRIFTPVTRTFLEFLETEYPQLREIL